MWHIGLDYHMRTSSIHILDARGVKVKAMTVRGGWPELVTELRGVADAAAAVGERLSICYEASCGYGHLFDRLSKIAAQVVVAHPGQLRLIYRSKRKNDRIDAAKLALLLLTDQVPKVWVPDVDVRSWRRLVEYRRSVMDKRTATKNQIRAILRTHGIEAPPRGKLWTKKMRPWLRALELPTESDAVQRDIAVEELEHQNQQIDRVTRELDRIGRRHAGVGLLRTIPGVGPRTAEAVCAYIDDARRFGNLKNIGAYFGLVPCQDSSAGVNRLGHITRQGPATVRKLLVEAAWQGIRRSAVIRAWYERIVGGKDERRKIALVATAHWLARVMLSMLKSGEAWRHEEKRQAPRDAAA
jgi:transposase